MLKKFRHLTLWIAESLIFPRPKNWKLVALCFAGATVFWFFNSLGKDYTTRIDYPVKFLYSQPGTVVVGKLPSSIELDVTAGGWNLLFLNLNPNRVDPIAIFLENPTATHYLTRSDLRALAADELKEFTLNYVITDTLAFDIQPLVTKTVVLQVDTTTYTMEPNHHRVGDIRVTPDTLVIEGPASQMELLSDTLYFPLNEKEIDRDVSETVETKFLPGKQLITTVPEIEVYFKVVEYVKAERRLPINRIGFPKDSSYYLSDSVLMVSAWIPQESKIHFDTMSINAVVYADSLSQNDSIWLPRLTPRVQYPFDLQYVPQWVRIIRKP